MLPKNLSTTYQQYKEGTDFIAHWLATTAEKLGYISETKSKKSKKRSKAKQNESGHPTQTPQRGRQTYTIAIKDFIVLAEYIAGKDEVRVPRRLAVLLDRTISLRQSYSATISSPLGIDVKTTESDDRHAFFLTALKKVQNVLRPRYAKGYVPSKKQPQNVGEVINMFEHLDREEPSEESQQAPDVARANMDISTSTVIYKAERLDGMQEDFFAFVLLLHDLGKLRSEVERAWEGYKQGLLDLVAVSITTNTAVDLARAMEEDHKDMFERHGGSPRMLDLYFAGSCMESGTTIGYKQRPDDDLNFKMYDLADTIFWTTSRLLGGFCAALPEQDNGSMEMKPGFYGIYDAASDRSQKSSREQFKEDKILLLEMLAEFFTACRIPERFSAEDELTRGLRTMFKTKEMTLSLIFAATLFLDIHHILRDEVDQCFERLSETARYARATISQNFEFHKDLRIETWPKENDDAVREFDELIKRWINDDPHLQTAEHTKRIYKPKPHWFFRQHPWVCGLWKYHIQIRLHEISIAFANAWGSIMACAHLDNAVQGEQLITNQWRDMCVAITLQGASEFFVGEPPNDPDDYLKRFALAMGLSATHFAKTGRKKKGLIMSKRGPQSLKELGAVLQTFRGRYADMNGVMDLRMEDVQKVVSKSTWEWDLDEHGRPTELIKDSDVTPGSKKEEIKGLPVAKLLGLLRTMLHAEVIEISFDFLTLHRQCWRLLRMIKDRCRDQLIDMYGSNYIEKETELPFIVGYVLLAATNTKQLGSWVKTDQSVNLSSAMLSDAADVVQGLADCEAGSLIVSKILPGMLGVGIDFETEEE